MTGVILFEENEENLPLRRSAANKMALVRKAFQSQIRSATVSLLQACRTNARYVLDIGRRLRSCPNLSRDSR